MKCQVLKTFVRRGESFLPGTIIDVPENMVLQMTGYVLPVWNAGTYQEQPQDASHATSPTLAIVPATCQAVKLVRGGGYRLCGAPLREGKNGHQSCSDMFCQVPQSSWPKYDRYRRHLA